MENDRHFKNLISEFLNEFILLFFPEWDPYLDCSSVVWLQKEQYNKPHEVPEISVCLVGLVKTDPSSPDYDMTPHVAIHIECETGYSERSINERIIEYQSVLFYVLEIPVLSIVLFQGMYLDGIGDIKTTNSFGSHTFMRSIVPYVAIGSLDGKTYLEQDNILGVALAPLMRWPDGKMVYANAEAMRKIAESNLPDKKIAELFSFVEAFQNFDEQQQIEYDAILEQNDYEKVGHMRKTSIEIGEEIGLKKGEAIGIEKGRQQILRSIVMCLGIRKYGNPPLNVIFQVNSISDLDRLYTMFDRIGTVSSWSELLNP